MNHKLLSTVSLLSLLVASNGIAMEKEIESEDADINTQISKLKTFFSNYDSKKYYASNSPEIMEILPAVKKIASKVHADQNSRKEDAFAVVTDGSFRVPSSGLLRSIADFVPSLAVVKRYGLTTNAFDQTLPLKQKEFFRHDIKEFVIEYAQVEILRTIQDKQNATPNFTETLYGNSAIRKDLSDVFKKLDEIYADNGITMKGLSIDGLMETMNAKN